MHVYVEKDRNFYKVNINAEEKRKIPKSFNVESPKLETAKATPIA